MFTEAIITTRTQGVDNATEILPQQDHNCLALVRREMTIATILAIAVLVMNSIEGLKLVMISIEGWRDMGVASQQGSIGCGTGLQPLNYITRDAIMTHSQNPFALPCAFRSDRSTSSSLHANGDPRCQRWAQQRTDTAWVVFGSFNRLRAGGWALYTERGKERRNRKHGSHQLFGGIHRSWHL